MTTDDNTGPASGARAPFAEAMVQAERAMEQLALAREQIANLEQALKTSRCIGMALGILMERHGMTSEDAFDMLRTASQRSHVKIKELAERVVFTGEIPAA